jgi:hypothetical protein
VDRRCADVTLRPSPADGLIRPLVVILALVALVLAGGGAYRATLRGVELVRHPSQGADLRFSRNRIEALRAQFIVAVPTGSRMYIDPSVVWGEWGQRLGEFAAMNGVHVVTDVAQADYHVAVVTAPDTRAGLRLTVERIGKA